MFFLDYKCHMLSLVSVFWVWSTCIESFQEKQPQKYSYRWFDPTLSRTEGAPEATGQRTVEKMNSEFWAKGSSISPKVWARGKRASLLWTQRHFDRIEGWIRRRRVILDWTRRSFDHTEHGPETCCWVFKSGFSYIVSACKCVRSPSTNVWQEYEHHKPYKWAPHVMKDIGQAHG